MAGIGADDRNARGLERQREIQRRLTAELNDDAIRLFDVVNVQHFFQRERLEVQAVAGVVIGGNGLRIAVDHDRFVVELRQCVGRVAAAIVELDALADAVGAAAEDHDFLAIAGVGFVFRFVARIEIRREAFEFGRAGVHAIEHGGDAELLAARAHGVCIGSEQLAQARVGNSVALGFEHPLARERAQVLPGQGIAPDPPFREAASRTTDRWR